MWKLEDSMFSTYIRILQGNYIGDTIPAPFLKKLFMHCALSVVLFLIQPARRALHWCNSILVNEMPILLCNAVQCNLVLVNEMPLCNAVQCNLVLVKYHCAMVCSVIWSS